jgi:hypothetical protein
MERSASRVLLALGDVLPDHRRAASYVDRILRAAKPGDLPVQFTTNLRWS